MVYDTTPERAKEVGEAVIQYIITGAVDNLPLEFRGLNVFGAIAALRENDELLHGENSNLNDEQTERRDEIEADIDRAVENKMHYYPFGHNRDVTAGTPRARTENNSLIYGGNH